MERMKMEVLHHTHDGIHYLWASPLCKVVGADDFLPNWVGKAKVLNGLFVNNNRQRIIEIFGERPPGSHCHTQRLHILIVDD